MLDLFNLIGEVLHAVLIKQHISLNLLVDCGFKPFPLSVPINIHPHIYIYNHSAYTNWR